jgi:hypothetical protein
MLYKILTTNVRTLSLKPTGKISRAIVNRIFLFLYDIKLKENLPSIKLLFENGISNSTSCTPSDDHGSLSRT